MCGTVARGLFVLHSVLLYAFGDYLACMSFRLDYL